MVEVNGSLKNLWNNLAKFTDAGLSGLANHAELTNVLGERLARNELTDEDLRNFLFVEQDSSPASVDDDIRGFWVAVYKQIFGRGFEIPAAPKMKSKTKAAIQKYNLMLVFIPAITEDEYPACFVKLAWGRHLTESLIERRPLPGRWVLVDRTPKSHLNAEDVYQDQLTKDLGLKTRFGVSWNDCENSHLPKFGKLLGVARKQVRLMTAEEWNFIGNLFNWLRANRSMDLPDLGATHSWEWCENCYDTEGRLLVGWRDGGGLADVRFDHPSYQYPHIGFRPVVVL